eukprot:580045-Prymnesium_polylepis.1
MGFQPDSLERSIEEEFNQNDDGKWLKEYEYVVNEQAFPEYPSSKGYAPTSSEKDIAEYTRDWNRNGKTLEEFVASQPHMEGKERLTIAECAVLRLYTGPVFKEWNSWARGIAQDSDRKDKWATSLAVLYSAVLKLSLSLNKKLSVFRGLKETTMKLPSTFLPDKGKSELAGGVE